MRKVFKIMLISSILNLIFIWLSTLFLSVTSDLDKQMSGFVKLYLICSIFYLGVTMILGLSIYSRNLVEILRKMWDKEDKKRGL